MKKNILVTCIGSLLSLSAICLAASAASTNNGISFNIPAATSLPMALTCNHVNPPWYLRSGNNVKSYASFAREFGIKSNTVFSCFIKPMNSGDTVLNFYGEINLAKNTAALQGSAAFNPYSVTWKNSQGAVIQPSQTAFHGALHAYITK